MFLSWFSLLCQMCCVGRWIATSLRPLLSPCGSCIAFSHSAVASGFPTILQSPTLVTDWQSRGMTGPVIAMKKDDVGNSVSIHLCIYLECHQCGKRNNQHKWSCCQSNQWCCVFEPIHLIRVMCGTLAPDKHTIVVPAGNQLPQLSDLFSVFHPSIE